MIRHHVSNHLRMANPCSLVGFIFLQLLRRVQSLDFSAIRNPVLLQQLLQYLIFQLQIIHTALQRTEIFCCVSHQLFPA